MALGALSLGALGVVYGDIGTSPLYALSLCVEFVTGKGMPVRTEEVLGVLSLIFWALTLVVSVKYLAVIMRADNDGEGGILALLALVTPRRGEVETRRAAMLAGLGIFGAALLYGDGVITPAISVLSAVEGLGVATHAFKPFVVPITVVLLGGLFAVQRFGTAGVGRFFGPAMLVWFFVIGALGAIRIAGQSPDHVSVLRALSPVWGARLLLTHGVAGLLILGCVVLAVTGAEALYADLGHFGALPIRVAWYFVVFPALVLNYFGQGALIIERSGHVAHPFFDLAPPWALYPLVGLSTIATIIASQSLISGAFSLTHQASQLGYAPRFTVVHTSKTERGQIYIPQVNLGLAIACIALVLSFRSSDALASAYGIAVTGTMSVTSVLFYVVARRRFGWPRVAAGALVGLFLLVDLSFFGANLDKVASGGWLPLAIAFVVFTVMTAWKRGRALVGQLSLRGGRPAEEFFAELERSPRPRVPGTAIFFTTNTGGIPSLLLLNLDANQALHERVILMTIAAAEIPFVRSEDRVTVVDMGHGFFRVLALFGFMEEPSVTEVIESCALRGMRIPPDPLYFLERDTLLTSGGSPMRRWRKRLFAFLWRNVPSAASTFHLPPGRVVELGMQLEL